MTLQTPRPPELRVAIPASLVSDTPHLREKTAKLGAVARTCAIFGVSEISLYRDDPKRNQREEVDFCKRILAFAETPQYLRKRLFGLDPSLKFTGILPPLQSPHHDVTSDIAKCQVGSIRDGVVVSERKNDLEVDVGLRRVLECSGTLSAGSRTTIRITSVGEPLTGEIVRDSEKPRNWGYQVRSHNLSLSALVRESEVDLKIGTSRYGTPIIELWTNLGHSLNTSRSVIVAFGSPKRGLVDILKDEDTTPNEVFDYFINTVPDQNVATIRTEEAMLASLSLLNLVGRFRG